MKVRTPDGKVHDLPVPDAVRLIHTSDAVPVVETDKERAEKRPAPKRAETRKGS